MARTPSSLIEAIFQVRGTDPLTQSLSTLGPQIQEGSDTLRRIRQRRPVDQLFPGKLPELSGVPYEDAGNVANLMSLLGRPQQQAELARQKALQQTALSEQKAADRLEQIMLQGQLTKPIIVTTDEAGNIADYQQLSTPGRAIVSKPQRQSVPKKRILPATTVKEIKGMKASLKLLDESLNELKQDMATGGKKIARYMGFFDPRANSRGLREVATNPKFVAFASRVERAFQEFRDATTGKQASFQELEYLKPLFPNIKNSPQNFIAVSDDVRRLSEKKLFSFIEELEMSGYDVSGRDSRNDLQGETEIENLINRMEELRQKDVE